VPKQELNPLQIAAASEFSAVSFDRFRPGSRSTVLGLGSFAVFCRRAILAASHAAGLDVAETLR
jgi:hypothetical protein